MTQAAQPARKSTSRLWPLIRVLLVVVLLLPVCLLVLLIVALAGAWLTGPQWLPQAGEFLADRHGYSLQLENVRLPALGELAKGQLGIGSMTLLDAESKLSIAANDVQLSWFPDADGRALLKLAATTLDITVAPALVEASGTGEEPGQLVPTPDSRAPGLELADALARLRQPPLPDPEQLLAEHPEWRFASPLANYLPRVPEDYEIEFSTLKLALKAPGGAHESVYEGSISASLSALGRPGARLKLNTTGDFLPPEGLRALAGELNQETPFGFQVATAMPLSAALTARPDAITVSFSAPAGSAELNLVAQSGDASTLPLAADGLGSRWQAYADITLDAAAIQARLRLPPQPPVTKTATLLDLERGRLTLNGSLALDASLLPAGRQPEDAQLAASLDLLAAGGPGSFAFTHTLRLLPSEGALRAELGPVNMQLKPVGVWWRTNSWFAESGLQPTVLQPWTLRSGSITCSLEDGFSQAGIEAALAETARQRALLQGCGWPLQLTLAGAGKVGNATGATAALTPALTSKVAIKPVFGKRPQSTQGASGAAGRIEDSVSALLPSSLEATISAAGPKLHALMPEQWSFATSARMQQTSSATETATQINMSDTSASLRSLTLPDLRVDSLDISSPKLTASLVEALAQDAGLSLQSAVGDIKASASIMPFGTPVKKPLAISLDSSLALTPASTGPLPDVALKLRSLKAAGLELEGDMKVSRQFGRSAGAIELSGTPDRQLMDLLDSSLAAAQPDLKLTAGKVLYAGTATVDFAARPMRWSTQGVAGLQRWTVATEQIQVSPLTISAGVEADQSGLKILGDGESLSTASTNIKLGELAFPNAFLKLTADLDYASAPLSGTVELQQARINAFKGDIALARPVTLQLPVSRHSEAPLKIPVALRGVDLRSLVAIENKHIDATGSVSGRLGLVYTGNSVRIPAESPGKLSADGHGWIRLKEAGQWQAMAGGNPQLLFAVGALGNFRYESLNGTVVFDDDEWLELALELQGRNPEVKDGRPIKYNLNVQSNILSLLKSLAMTDNLSRSLEERVLKAYE